MRLEGISKHFKVWELFYEKNTSDVQLHYKLRKAHLSLWEKETISEVFLFERKAENVEYENHVRLFSGKNQTIIISIQNISHPELEVKSIYCSLKKK